MKKSHKIVVQNAKKEYNVIKQNKKGREIRCSCGKLIAIERQGKVFIKCKGCKQEVEIPLPRAKSQEPRA